MRRTPNGRKSSTRSADWHAPARIEGTQMVVVLPVESVPGRGMAQ